MPGGRKRKLDRPVEWKIRIPSSVAKRVVAYLSLTNPMDDTPPFGSRSKLMEKLLRAWLKEQDESVVNLDDLLIGNSIPVSKKLVQSAMKELDSFLD